jgi:preprotein translocase SecE subunit
MAVAVKNTPEVASQRPINRLAVASFLGVLYVLGSLAVVFYGVPALWSTALDGFTQAVGTPVSTALQIVVMVAAFLGLFVLGFRLAVSEHVAGLSAGIFFGLLGVLAIIGLTCLVGNILEHRLADRSIALAITLAVGIGLCVGAAIGFLRPAFGNFLRQVEEQGWFSARPYKRNQGQRVRRGTILGILVLAGCGIYSLLVHKTLVTVDQDWGLNIPFTHGPQVLVLLPAVAITLPLVLSAATLWLAYRIVNFPAFADFLIATEAEVNKVSWTTRKRLVQDTIVVLVTVILLTVFLFFVDQIWAFLLTQVRVIQISPADAKQVSPKDQPW